MKEYLHSKTFTVSLIGRPNVGKSGIFNCLIGNPQYAIVADKAGVTRDRNFFLLKEPICEYLKEAPEEINIPILLADTGGFFAEEIAETDTDAYFFNIMKKQAELAIEESDLLIFVLDYKDKITHYDREIFRFFSRHKKNVLVVVNKCDTSYQENDIAEFQEFEAIPVSAVHNRGIEHLKRLIVLKAWETQERILRQQQEEQEREESPAFSVAILGAPNAGKSTLLNTILKAPRSLVAPIPGTTIDPIHDYFELKTPHFEGTIKLIDTAGIRKKSSIKGTIEYQSVYRSLRSMEESDVVLFLIDSEKLLSHQDKRLLDLSFEKGKSIIIVFTKSDLLEFQIRDKKLQPDQLALKFLKKNNLDLQWLDFCQVHLISCHENNGIGGLLNSLGKTLRARFEKIPTAKLNSFLQALIDEKTIFMKGKRGGNLKLKYASQVSHSPPTFILFTNRIKDIPDHYRRFLQNSLRKEFQIHNTPVHLVFRSGNSE